MEIRVLDRDIPEHETNVTQAVMCQCGCSNFLVYKGYYRTVVECANCGKKYCVHDG